MAPRLSGPLQVQSPVGVPNPLSNMNSTCRTVGLRRVFVQTETGETLGVDLDGADTAQKLKKTVQAPLSVPTEQSELFLRGHTVDDLNEFRNSSPVFLARSMTRCYSSPCIAPRSDVASPEVPRPLELLDSMHANSHMRRLLKEASKAVECGVDPEPATGGLGGAYYFKNREGQNIAIVKPTDEEPFAHNNPNGYVGRTLGQPGLKRTIRVGEAGPREVAAYLLDHGGFASVPPTSLVKAVHSIFHVNGGDGKGGWERAPVKVASFQQYVQHDFDASEHGTSRFPVSAVHRIGILDIRIFNTDRHSGNILVRRTTGGISSSSSADMALRVDDAVQLIPIDHGFCLPESVESAYFEWLHWPQVSLPFSLEELDYINALDAEADADMLKSALPMLPTGALRMLVMATALLQQAAAAGFTLGEIGGMMSRELRGMDEEASQFEVMCADAKLRLERQLAETAAADRQLHHDLRKSVGDEEFESVGEPLHFEMDQEEEESIRGFINLDVAGGEESQEHALVKKLSKVCTEFTEAAQNRNGSMSTWSPLSGSPTPSSSVSSPFGAHVSPCSTPPLLRLEETEIYGGEGEGVLRRSSAPSSAVDVPSLPAVTKKLSAQNKSKLSNNVWTAKSPLADTLAAQPFSYPTMAYRALGPRVGNGLGRGEIGSASELEKAFPADGDMIFSELSDRLWALYMEVLKEVMQSSLKEQKEQAGMSAKRFGTSCKF